ncbi:hypothetical protein EJB05_30748, partial [Eragrostis curvula]
MDFILSMPYLSAATSKCLSISSLSPPSRPSMDSSQQHLENIWLHILNCDALPTSVDPHRPVELGPEHRRLHCEDDLVGWDDISFNIQSHICIFPRLQQFSKIVQKC